MYSFHRGCAYLESRVRHRYKMNWTAVLNSEGSAWKVGYELEGSGKPLIIDASSSASLQYDRTRKIQGISSELNSFLKSVSAHTDHKNFEEYFMHEITSGLCNKYNP
jgi:hypothetical protein